MYVCMYIQEYELLKSLVHLQVTENDIDTLIIERISNNNTAFLHSCSWSFSIKTRQEFLSFSIY